MNSGSAGPECVWLSLTSTCSTVVSSTAAIRRRSRSTTDTGIAHRSQATIAARLPPAASTRTVAVRSLSIAWMGSANSRIPGRLMPRGGLITRRATPARSALTLRVRFATLTRQRSGGKMRSALPENSATCSSRLKSEMICRYAWMTSV